MNKLHTLLCILVFYVACTACTSLMAQAVSEGKASLQTTNAPVYKSRKNQTQVPVYRSAKDSVLLAITDALLARLTEENDADLKLRDSIENKRNTLREQAILRYRTIYGPSHELHCSTALLLPTGIRSHCSAFQTERCMRFRLKYFNATACSTSSW